MNALNKKTSKVVNNIVKSSALFVFLCHSNSVSALSYMDYTRVVKTSNAFLRTLFNPNTLILLIGGCGLAAILIRMYARNEYKKKKESLDNIGVEKIERRDSIQKVEFEKLEKKYAELRESRNLMNNKPTNEDELGKTVVLSKITLDVDPDRLEKLEALRNKPEEVEDEVVSTVEVEVKEEKSPEENEVKEESTTDVNESENTENTENNENNEQSVDENGEESDVVTEDDTEEETQEEEFDDPNIKKIGKKLKNVLDKTLELKKRQVHEFALDILESLAAREEYKTVLNTFVIDYVNTKYIKQCDFESKNAKTLRKYVNVELENTCNKLIAIVDRSYTNEYVRLIYNIFLIINKIDCMDTNIEKAIYECNTLDIINKDELIKKLKKSYKTYYTIFYDYMKKLEIDKFKLIYTKLNTEGMFNNGDLLMTNISSSIQFSKIFSDYIINKTYGSDIILEDVREVQLKLISFNILEDMLHFNYKKKYIINFPVSLYSKEKKIKSLLNAVGDTYSQNKVFILIDMEILKDHHEMILKLKREGFRFMIQVTGETIKLYDEVKKHLSLVEYLVYVGPRLNKATLKRYVPSYLLKKIIYADKNLVEGVVIK